jgi:hypothetical protein
LRRKANSKWRLQSVKKNFAIFPCKQINASHKQLKPYFQSPNNLGYGMTKQFSQTLLIIGLFLCFFLSGCTVEKRRYTKGYHVTWHSRDTKPAANTELARIEKPKSPATALAFPLDSLPSKHLEPSALAFASADTAFNPIHLTNHVLSTYLKNHRGGIDRNTKSDSCDVVVTYWGEEITCKVVELNETMVKYRNCTKLDGPLVSIPKRNIASILYANGERIVLRPPVQTSATEKHESLKDQNRYLPIDVVGIIGLTVGIISIPIWWFINPGTGLIAGGVAIVLGIIGLIRTAKRNRKRKGFGYSIASILLGLILITLTLLFFTAAGALF